MFELFQPTHLVVFLIAATFLVLPVIAWWRIFARTGNPGPLGLLMWIPVVNLILVFWLAFSAWPMERIRDSAVRSNLCPSCGRRLN
ncbi:MAG: hypothetical protein JOZ62_12785 [Acidobacteriaceae bacterium]|nr:hypothetical protein [Acidobacteriaceae bacterium]